MPQIYWSMSDRLETLSGERFHGVWRFNRIYDILKLNLCRQQQKNIRNATTESTLEDMERHEDTSNDLKRHEIKYSKTTSQTESTLWKKIRRQNKHTRTSFDGRHSGTDKLHLISQTIKINTNIWKETTNKKLKQKKSTRKLCQANIQTESRT